jgi:DNA-binding GntR family transcriptional regulator
MIQDRDNDNLRHALSGFGEYASHNEFVPMRELIYQYLRDAIIERRFEAGAHLVEDDLAHYLNASRTPVREALRKLESEGLVKHHLRRGVEVRQLGLKDVSDIYDVTTMLEGYAAKLVAESATAETIERLHFLLQQMRASIEATDNSSEQELHQEFHATIYEACHNKRVEGLLKTYNAYIQLFRTYTMEVPGRLQHSWQEHECIVQAIVKHDGDLAQKCAYEHLSGSKETFLRQWQKWSGE